jgi:hypothetical protein
MPRKKKIRGFGRDEVEDGHKNSTKVHNTAYARMSPVVNLFSYL